MLCSIELWFDVNVEMVLMVGLNFGCGMFDVLLFDL